MAALNPSKPKPKGPQTIFWWIVWISLTIGSFFVASALWTPIIAKHYGSVRETNASIFWVVSVFGTWMIFLIPLIIVMYAKVDKAYEDARIRKEQNAARFRSISVDAAKRILPQPLQQKMISWPKTIATGHLVQITLKDGRKMDHVFISEGREILGIYNATEFDFEGKDVADIEPVDLAKIPLFLANLWLRLDGIGASL